MNLPMFEADLLLSAKWIFPVDEISWSIENGELAVKGGKIIYVGTKIPDHWQEKLINMPK